MKEQIYNQLRNNIEAAFVPPEYSIANSFLVSGFSFKEMQEILTKTELSQIYRVKIENAYQDFVNNPNYKYCKNAGIWQNEQIDYLRIQKLRNER